jgi:hypothetical protein
MTGQRSSRGALLGGVAIAAVAVAAIWIAQGTENLCPAIYPSPPSCSVDARTTPAVVGTVLVFALLALTLVLAWRSTPRRVSTGLLAAAGAIAPWWVFGSAGFIVDGTAMVLLLCSVSCVGIAVAATRRIRPEDSTSTPVTP